MTVKRILVVLVTVALAIGLVGLVFAADTVTGKITKIEGNKLTIMTMDKKEATVEVKSAKDLKVGDEVTVKDGMATKMMKKKAVEGC
ncbi:MAG: hypothetical protein ABR903_09840 [Thermodesulfovibrionales bacterium]|jgi:Flp pilus assembly protein CpaB